MILTHENYFSTEASIEYCGSTQYKNFAGCMGIPACEAKAMAMLYEGFEDLTEKEKEAGGKTAFLLGNYMDAHFTGDLDLFVANHPEIISTRGATKGELKADYKQANNVIAKLESDKFFMDRIQGEKQKIFTGEMFGTKWKICVDAYLEGIYITDFKYMADIRKQHYVKDSGYMNYIEFYGYHYQAAIYQEIVFQNTGKRLPFYHAVADKQVPYPDYAIIQIPQAMMDGALCEIESNMPRLLQVKNKEVEPDSCGKCNYCLSVKKLDRIIFPDELF